MMHSMSADGSQTTPEDAAFVREAIRLATAGRGRVEPNPMVGCVLVKNGRVIGRGIHERFGGPHAEPTALASCTESPAGATAYVTLEPCCHLNKKTPPCVPQLLAAGVVRVVVGCLDPNPEVDGKGVAQLRGAGVLVDLAPADVEAEAKQLLAPFTARTTIGRPYVTLKWAQSADGFVGGPGKYAGGPGKYAGGAGKHVGGPGGSRVQISNAASSRAVHALRARCDVIVVGINTVLSDDPMLTSRGVPDHRPLLRVVLDRRLRLPRDCTLVRTARDVPTRVICDEATFRASPRVRKLRSLGVTVSGLDDDGSGGAFLTTPGVCEATHVLVEPGPTLARSMLPWADRLWVIRSDRTLGFDDTAPRAADVPANYVCVATRMFEGDELSEYLNTASPVYFSPVASADV